MPRNHHCNPFRSARSHHVSYGSTPEVVKEPSSDLCIFTSLTPRFSEVLDPVGSVRVGEHMRNQTASLLPPLPLSLEKRLQFIIRVNGPSLVVLGFPGLQPYNPKVLKMLAVNLAFVSNLDRARCSHLSKSSPLPYPGLAPPRMIVRRLDPVSTLTASLQEYSPELRVYPQGARALAIEVHPRQATPHPPCETDSYPQSGAWPSQPCASHSPRDPIHSLPSRNWIDVKNLRIVAPRKLNDLVFFHPRWFRRFGLNQGT